MTESDKQKIIDVILEREALKKYSKLQRLFKDPIRTIPYYILASLTRVRPYKVSFKTLWGDKISGYLPNASTFLYHGYAEANLTNFLLKKLRDSDVFIDGGANIGFYSLLASNLMPVGSVHSFEPTPSTFKNLGENTKNKRNIFINDNALSDRVQEIKFIDYGAGFSAFNSTTKRSIVELKNKGREITVETISLDQYCEGKKINPTFIKFDLEGSEYPALLGSKRIITRNKPLISLEVAGDKEWIENIQKSHKFLISNNYKPYSINNDGSLEKHSLEDSYKYDNLIYVPKEKENLFHDNN